MKRVDPKELVVEPNHVVVVKHAESGAGLKITFNGDGSLSLWTMAGTYETKHYITGEHVYEHTTKMKA
jgi:hypothetical protein